MAQLMRLSLCLAIIWRATVGEEDQSCVLQSQNPRDVGAVKHHLNAVNASEEDLALELMEMEEDEDVEEVTCGDEGFYDFDFSPGEGRFLKRRDELAPNSGVYFASHNPKDTTTCLGGAIWTEEVATGDRDLKNCPKCNLLVVYADDSSGYEEDSKDEVKINDCSEGPSILRLKLKPARKVLGFEFWDNEEEPEDRRDRSGFGWKNEEEEDAEEPSEWGRALIPQTKNGEGTGFVSIAKNKVPPSNVADLMVRYAGSGGLRSIRFCGSKPGSGEDEPAPAPTNRIAPQVVEKVSCPKGSSPYTYDFKPGDGRKLKTNERITPNGPVYFIGFDKKSTTKCIGGGIWTPETNRDDSDLLGCPGNGVTKDCNLLVVVEDESRLADPENIKIDDCGQGPTTIKLQLKAPQPVLGFQFWDNEEKGSTFKWTNANSGGTATVNIPITSNNQGVSVDISGNQVAPPSAVQYIDITYGGSGGFQSLTLCRRDEVKTTTTTTTKKTRPVKSTTTTTTKKTRPVKSTTTTTTKKTRPVKSTTTTTTTKKADDPVRTTTTKAPGVVGDPHIETFEGQHYLLLSQGNFDLWHINGLKTTMKTAQNLMKTLDVNWQIYTHYSGRMSFTKGLLVVDKTGGKLRQMAELTAKDCKWRTKVPGGDWEVVKGSKLFSVLDGQDFVTGMKLGLETQHLKLSRNTEQGKQNVAGIYWSCRPAHHINLRMHMYNEGDKQFVQGEVRGLSKRKDLPRGDLMLQTASGSEMQLSDQEFSVQRGWQELGGSEDAAAYLQAIDEPGPISHFLASCSAAEKKEAIKICTKHMGHLVGDQDFQDCVTDVCNGSGEVSAELAAELLEVSRREDDSAESV